jgi:hypothetical protein
VLNKVPVVFCFLTHAHLLLCYLRCLLFALQLLSGNKIGNITLSPVLLEKVRHRRTLVCIAELAAAPYHT